MHEERTQLTRRRALLAGGAAVALAGAVRHAAAAPSIQSGGGIAGGGVIEVEGGEATFSVFGSRFEVEGQDEPLVFGNLIWADANGVRLESSEVTDYGPVEGEENARKMMGFLTMDGKGRHPFTLELVDNGGPGEGRDRLTLTVQASDDGDGATPAAGEPVYAAEGEIAAGDLALLDFEFPK